MDATKVAASAGGLSARQAADRLAADGPNAVPAPAPRRLLDRSAGR